MSSLMEAGKSLPATRQAVQAAGRGEMRGKIVRLNMDVEVITAVNAQVLSRFSQCQIHVAE